MRISTAIRTWIARTIGGSSTAARWAAGADLESTGGAVMTDPYSQAGVVYGCVQALAENLANIPLRVSRISRSDRSRTPKSRKKQVGEDIIGSGPLYELLNQPHPQLSRFDFWELVVAWLHLRGVCYIVALGNGDEILRIHGRRPNEKPMIERLAILPSTSVTPIRAGRELLGFRYMPGIEQPLYPLNLLPEEVLLLRLPALTDYWSGMAPAIVAQIAASTDFAAAQFMRGLMLNNADQGIIVSTDQWLSDEQRAQIGSALIERKRKAGTADRPLILGGGLRVEKPSISNVDLQYLESRNFNRRELCAIFRVPENILGHTADSNRSVGIEQRQNFIEFRIAPLGERLATAIAPIIRAFEPNAESWWDLDASPVMQEARRARFAAARAAFDMGITLRDLNDLFDLGLPDYPWSNRAYIPFSLAPVDEERESEKPELPAGSTPAAEGQPDAPTAPAAPAQQDAFTALAGSLRAARNGSANHVCAAHGEYVSSISGSIRKKKTILRRFFFGQRARVLERLESTYGKGALPTATRSLDDLWSEAAEDDALIKTLRPALLRDLKFGGAQVWRELGLADTFDVPPAAAMEFLGRRVNMIKSINETTWSEIRDSLNEGLGAGDTYQQLVERVKDTFRGVTQTRAETIALTETNVAVNSGRYSGMEEAGVEKKAWLSSNLENSRPSHQQAGRDYSEGIPIERPFRVDGELLDFPGDPKGSSGNTINCKCTVLAVLDEKAVIPSRMLRFEEFLDMAPKRPVDAPEGPNGKTCHTTPENHFASKCDVLQNGLVAEEVRDFNE